MSMLTLVFPLSYVVFWYYTFCAEGVKDVEVEVFYIVEIIRRGIIVNEILIIVLSLR